MAHNVKVIQWGIPTKSPTIESAYNSSADLRRHFLEILRLYDVAEKDKFWTEYIRVIYIKLVKSYIPLLNKTIIQKTAIARNMTYDCYLKNEQLIAFKKNCLKLKKKCEESTIEYYNYLPGKKLPLYIRTKIINYISPVPI